MGRQVRKCKTVEGVLTERMVFVWLYNVVRLVLGDAAQRQRVDVERLRGIGATRWCAST
jgi:hypothetical protein